ncbi:hypothetical protein P170DRAFT_23327 [Aspergillus steynii IBT 23096]|uniref:Uncharacterized protein n=1 Tax=Aspergillus steynii IBT 23096 TaxID=1392250 RepID=A0A2I2GP55_9EURO|nr:uncharacterized protein P170DRAFT_23327 [Aspergillus steynii IBT 23096]PLB54661.1 hypothetical protein P170DRAFT_23327 [Aspergillus steynii IBT 23096]
MDRPGNPALVMDSRFTVLRQRLATQVAISIANHGTVDEIHHTGTDRMFFWWLSARIEAGAPWIADSIHTASPNERKHRVGWKTSESVPCPRNGGPDPSTIHASLRRWWGEETYRLQARFKSVARRLLRCLASLGLQKPDLSAEKPPRPSSVGRRGCVTACCRATLAKIHRGTTVDYDCISC